MVCITLYPFFRDLGIEPPDEYGGTADEYRKILREVVATNENPNLHLIEGPDLLEDLSGLTADLIHPGDHGMAEMGQRLAERLGRFINAAGRE